MSSATTMLVIITIVSSFLISLVTGAGAVTAFQDLDEPDSFGEWVTFGGKLVVAIAKLIFAVMTFDIIPDLPTTFRVVVSTIFGFVFIKWIVQDVIPAIGSITPFT